MKTRISIFIPGIFLLLAGCNPTPEEVVQKFNAAFNGRDIATAANTLAPDLVVIDNNGEVNASSRDEYIQDGIMWATTFENQWLIREISSQDNRVFTRESDSSDFILFLYGQTLDFRYSYTIQDSRIQQMKYDSIAGFAELEARANKKYSELYGWILINYPDQIPLVTSNSAEGTAELKRLFDEFKLKYGNSDNSP